MMRERKKHGQMIFDGFSSSSLSIGSESVESEIYSNTKVKGYTPDSGYMERVFTCGSRSTSCNFLGLHLLLLRS